MAFVISVQGCHAVGKSSLVVGLRNSLPTVECYCENTAQVDKKKHDTHLRMDVEEEYYQIQEWYVALEALRFQGLPSYKTVVLDRGPEEKDFYIRHYPRIVLRQGWDVEDRFAAQLQKLRDCRSDRILLLAASRETILRRYSGDEKRRPTFETWLEKWHPEVDAFFRSLPQTVVLTTDYLSKAEVLAWTITWIEQGCPLGVNE